MWKLAIEISTFVSDIGTIIFAGIGTWIAYQTFLRMPEQKREPVNENEISSRFSSVKESIEALNDIDHIVFYQTQIQRTILKGTAKGLECILSDYRPGKSSGTQWFIPKNDLKNILDNKDYNVQAGLRLKTGTFRIGKYAEWVYSKLLFPKEEEFESRITQLLKNITGEQLK